MEPEAPKSNEVILICIDAMGSRTHAKDQVLGPFIFECVNSAGWSIHDHLDAEGICSDQNQLQLEHVFRSPFTVPGDTRAASVHQLDQEEVRKALNSANKDKATGDWKFKK